ncbi:30S ribosomal protein S9 [Candidatus Parcubacteria bacterium]|nr:MAG: 30S ribosomal protein S9 [Candidatus Parcubacteria bacterium]
MAEKYFQTVGRRKLAIAQARVFPSGSGKITVNGKDLAEYLKSDRLVDIVMSPLKETGKSEEVDVTVRAIGGGLSGQADAMKLAIARALVKWDESLKTVVKTHGFLTRDARRKERKKFGKRGARRSPQWRKR